MKLIVNGQERESAAPTVAGLLDEFGMAGKLVVVEIDGDIVPRDQWEAKTLSEGMKIELVHFVGGG